MDAMHCDTETVFLQAVEQYGDMVYRVAWQNLRQREDAQDVTQEVFLRLFRQPDPPRGEHLKAWLLRVTINLCKNIHKSPRRRVEQPLVDESFPFSDEQARLLDEIFRLPVRYRNVLYLYYYEGYKQSEIAAMLASNEKTVSSLLSRARKKLKAYLTEGGLAYE